MTIFSRNNSRHGFSLMELLLVVVILGVLSAVLVPRFGIALEGGKTAVAARSVAQLGRYARTMALLNQMPIDLVLDLGSSKVSVSAGTLSGYAPVKQELDSGMKVDELSGDEHASLIESSSTQDGGARFGFARSQDEKDNTASESWFRGDDDSDASKSLDDVFGEDDDGGLAEEIATEETLSSVSLAFSGYTDSSEASSAAENGVIRVRYRTNGTCRPYEVKVTGERAGDVMIIAVDCVGTPVIMTDSGKVYGKEDR